MKWLRFYLDGSTPMIASRLCWHLGSLEDCESNIDKWYVCILLLPEGLNFYLISYHITVFSL
jgi:hypothetical protein